MKIRNANRKFDKTIKLESNALLKIRPELFDEWDFEKNNEIGLDVYKVTKGSEKKGWWICPKCKSSYDARINHRKEGKNCPYCSGKKINHTNSLMTVNPSLSSEWHPTRNGRLTPDKVTVNNGKKVWWLGKCGHEWSAIISNRNSGIGCPYCRNYKTLKGFNDVWTTNPDLASMLVDPEDGHKYTQGSEVKVDWKCSNCEELIKNKAIYSVKEQGLNCTACSNNISYPEKVMIALLTHLGIYFEHDKSHEWSDNRRFDFYIPSLNLIIETHGRQHYEQGFSTVGGRSLREELENDRYKNYIALINNIKDYIVIDCRYSDFEYIKNNILSSKLKQIMNINDTDFNNMNIHSDNVVVEAWKLWNDYKSVKEISDELNIHIDATYRFLRRGNALNKCNYNRKEARRRSVRMKPVVKLSTDNYLMAEYESLREAERNNKRTIATIKRYCNDRERTLDGFKWMYKDDYEKYIEEQKQLM